MWRIVDADLEFGSFVQVYSIGLDSEERADFQIGSTKSALSAPRSSTPLMVPLAARRIPAGLV
jgi:hypothetical protein